MTAGTVNGPTRGNTEDRRRRREWLVATFAADVNLNGEPACRCFRCGALLTADTVSADRIIPGCKGGTYRRNNIRPACLRCQSITGNQIKAAMRGRPPL